MADDKIETHQSVADQSQDQIEQLALLQSNLREVYGDNFQAALLEQYKVYVEMIDRISARRGQMNSFYTSLLSSLLAFISLIGNKDISSFQEAKLQMLSIIGVLSLGVILCMIWHKNIQSYKHLNSGKFKVLHEMEKYMPFPCYTKEWEILAKDSRYKDFLTQTKVEKYVPLAISLLYLSLLVYFLLKFMA
jgi:hypothetical protein